MVEGLAAFLSQNPELLVIIETAVQKAKIRMMFGSLFG